MRLLLSAAGEFLSLETVMSEKRAFKSLVFRGMRTTNQDMLLVAVIKLRLITNKRQEGLVTFEAEHHTVFINGDTGNLVPPHLTAESQEWVKYEHHQNECIAYAREIVPDAHPLVARGWKALPSHVWEVH